MKTFKRGTLTEGFSHFPHTTQFYLEELNLWAFFLLQLRLKGELR